MSWIVATAVLLAHSNVTPTLSFEPNRGQTSAEVEFLARTPTGVIFATAHNEIVFQSAANPRESALKWSFSSTNPAAKWSGEHPNPGSSTHYMIGRDRSRWIHNLPAYQRLFLRQIYPGIDLVIYGNAQNELEYDLIVAPEADPSRIRFRLPGASIHPATGDLHIGGKMRQRKPVASQQPASGTVTAAFVQYPNGEFGFQLGGYDRSKPLTIDPVIESREYIGGAGDDSVVSIRRVGPYSYEAVGNTTSIDFPDGPPSLRHGTDVFYRLVLDPAGLAVTATTTTYFYGGTGDDFAAKGSSLAGIAGTTSSRDLITQADAQPPQREFAGGATDGFLLTFISSDPTRPRFSYLGSAGDDRIEAISGTGVMAVVGTTNGAAMAFGDFSSSPQSTNAGGTDVFIAGFFQNLTLFAATFLGGAGNDSGHAIRVTNEQVFVAGETTSANFPVTPGAAQTQRRGASDAFVTRYALTSSLTSSLTIGFTGFRMVNSTLLGGNDSDRILALPAAEIGDIADIPVVGTTRSTDLSWPAPTQQLAYGGGTSDAFFAFLSLDLSRLSRGSYVGGSGADEGLTGSIGGNGDLVIAGKTDSRNFPVKDALQSLYGGGASDGFLLHFDPAGVLLQSSYFGGSGDDEILSALSLNGPGMMVAGATTSTDLPGPAAAGSFQPIDSRRLGTREGFVARLVTSVFSAPPKLAASKYLPVRIPISVGDLAAALDRKTITAVSSDPSRVLVAFTGEPVASETTILPVSGLNAHCLGNSGSATVTLSAAGFANRQVRIACVEPEMQFQLFSALPLLVGSGGQAQLTFWVTDPDTGERTSVFPVSTMALPFPPVTLSSNNPSALRIQLFGSPVTSLRELPQFFDLVGLASGNVTLTAAAPGNGKTATLSLQIVQPYEYPRVIGLAPGFATDMQLPSGFGGRLVRIRSLDPTRVLLSLDGSAGSASIEMSTGIFQIIAVPGSPKGAEIRLEMSASGFPTTNNTLVRIVDADALYFPAAKLSLQAGEKFNFNFALRHLETGTVLTTPARQPAPTLAIANSNPAIATMDASIPLGGFTTLTAVSPGLTILTVTPPPGVVLPTNRLEVRVSAKPAPQFPGFDLGKDLVSTRTIQLPVRESVPYTVSTNSPAVGLGPQGASQVSGFSRSDGTITFDAIGQDFIGQAQLTLAVQGYPTVTASVQLRLAGFVWTSTEHHIAVNQTVSRFAAASAAIDPVTRLPLAMQPFRSGMNPDLPTVTNSNAQVAQLSGSVLSPSVSGVAAGTAILTLQQPSSGWVTPAVRQQVRVVVSEVSFASQFRLFVSGNGSLQGANACTTNPCTIAVALNTTLTPIPAAGWRFQGWLQSPNGSYCTNSSATCTLRPDRAGLIDVTAVFVPDVAGLQFLPIAPCRLVDTRNPDGPLGGPTIPANSTRRFPLRSACSLPANAAAYALNVTVVPKATLGYISIWPGGQAQPVVSTLNSLDGRIKANAAVVPAGADGSVELYATDATDVILDVNGVFVPAGSNTAGQVFYPVTPCRVADTRNAGAGTLQRLETRSFPVAGSCTIPTTATAYALNVTVVPKGPLGFLTLWPNNGSAQPTVSTLNALTGTVTANMAIVPAGTSGAVQAFVTDATDVILDITGYFGPPGQGVGYRFFPLTPCRVSDSRFPDVILPEQSTRPSPVQCGAPIDANAYSLNATVVPAAILGYLTLFPPNVTRPVVSTLNAVDGSITSNAALVPSGLAGAISAYVTERTHLILDINGYFAP